MRLPDTARFDPGPELVARFYYARAQELQAEVDTLLALLNDDEAILREVSRHLTEFSEQSDRSYRRAVWWSVIVFLGALLVLVSVAPWDAIRKALAL